MRQAELLRENTRELEMNLSSINRNSCCCSISDAQCFVFVEIGRNGGISVKELADNLRLDKSGISRTVDELVRKGLVKRQQSKTDRRYVVLDLTNKGTARFNKIESEMDQRFTEILKRIPRDKRRQVIEGLELYNAALESSMSEEDFDL